MSGSSEEKNLPASTRKLTSERRKGRVAKAPDMQSAIVTITLIGWLLATASQIPDQFNTLIHAAAQALTLDFPEACHIMLAALRDTLIRCALVPLLIAVIAAILGGLLINRGFLFAIDPIIPKFEKINPVSGFKNLFKSKNFIELGIAILKAILFGAILAGIAWSALNTLTRIPTLPPAALPHIVRALLVPMLGGACLCYFVAGLTDLMVQRSLFLKEMRMTQTEAKNERKETLGNPQIKSQRRRIAAENRANPVRLGPNRATLMICSPDLTIGLRYNPADTPVPRIVCKGTGRRAAEYRTIAQTNAIPVHWLADLATRLDRAFKPGMPITSAFFPEIARAIQQK